VSMHALLLQNSQLWIKGVAHVAKVSAPINTAVAAANAVDKVLGFLAHLA
jgi:hypothetical protein